MNTNSKSSHVHKQLCPQHLSVLRQKFLAAGAILIGFALAANRPASGGSHGVEHLHGVFCKFFFLRRFCPLFADRSFTGLGDLRNAGLIGFFDFILTARAERCEAK